MASDRIIIRAREHNLKNIDQRVLRDQCVVYFSYNGCSCQSGMTPRAPGWER